MKKNFEAIGFVVSWLTIIIQFILIIQNRVTDLPETIVRFFSFFTILTNLLVALFFTTRVFNIQNGPLAILKKNAAITAITVYILIVSIVYQVVLRAIWQPTGIQRMIDELLHTLIPLYFFIYWIFSLPGLKLKIKPVMSWLIYPGLYITFILIRGHYSGYYPYPFLDIGKIGLANVLKSIVIFLSSMIILQFVLIYLGKFLQKKMAVTSLE